MGPDQELDRLMHARHVPEMRSNLAERIIDAAQVQQKQGRSKPASWLLAFNDVFMIPKPAYVMAVLFVIGIAMGVNLDISSLVGAEEDVASAYVYTAEGVTEGDWL